MKKKLIYIFFVLVMIIGIFPIKVRAETIQPEISAPSAILIDSKTHEVLYEKNADEKLHMASITKIMTMLIAMERLESGEMNLEDKVTVSSYAASMGGSQLFLEAGEVRSVDELLYGIAIESGNDAATALAEHMGGGSLDNFLVIMNNKAKELGMTNTNFADACGLADTNHYSSARDISVMSSELLKYEKIYDYISTWTKEIYIGKNNDVLRTLVNTNKLISQTTYIDGIKTGYSSAAKYCLSATAEGGDMRLICVILAEEDSSTRFADAKALIDYGIANYSGEYIVKSGDVVGQIPVINSELGKTDLVAAEDVYILKSNTQDDKEFTQEIITSNDVLYAPIQQGDAAGILKVNVSDGNVYEIPLLVKESSDKISWFVFYKRIASYFLL